MNPIDKAISIAKFQEPAGTLEINPAIISGSKIESETESARK